jgi:hypothetical protein
MEKRDRERAAEANVARLEAECEEIERKLDLARADAELAASAEAPTGDPVKQQSCLPTRHNAASRDTSVCLEDLGAIPVLPITSDQEALGARYGP